MDEGLYRSPIYRGESRFHTSATVNIAALAGTVLQNPSTRILNAADPAAMTVAEIAAAIATLADPDGAVELARGISWSRQIFL